MSATVKVVTVVPGAAVVVRLSSRAGDVQRLGARYARVTAGGVAPFVPAASHILTEASDFLTTEANDRLTTES